MSYGGFEPQVIQDFLTESAELLDRFESDLSRMLADPGGEGVLHSAFRSLHTIKGSASFLMMEPMVELTHAAEDALNAVRAGGVAFDAGVHGVLTRASAGLRGMLSEVELGRTELSPAEASLIGALHAVAAGERAPAEAAVVGTLREASPTGAGPFGARVRSLELPPEKADLVGFLVADLEETLDKAQRRLDDLSADADRGEAGGELVELGDALAKNAEFFGYDSMRDLADGFLGAAQRLGDVDDAGMAGLLPRLRAVCLLMGEQAKGLSSKQLLEWPTEELIESLNTAASGRDNGLVIGEGTVADAVTALRAVGIEVGEPQKPDAPGSPAEPADEVEPVFTPAAVPVARVSPPGQTVRVELDRLDALDEHTRELERQQSQVAALAEELMGSGTLDAPTRERVAAVAGGLRRATNGMRLAVIRARMQPLEQLFSRCPRMIGDLASKTGKKVRLETAGGLTEVDRAVVEQLSDPLVHLLRNCVDHGIESPAERTAAGKMEEGLITLAASRTPGRVRIVMTDDGRGLERSRLVARAVERGLVSEEEAAGMSGRAVNRLVFMPGFSTVESVSDLSGRGVGMDVVLSNIEHLGGTVEIESAPGRGTVITIMLPVKLSAERAVTVGVGGARFALPLEHVVEVIRPEEGQFTRAGESALLRLTDESVPVVDGAGVFGVGGGAGRYGVVLSSGGLRAVLMVDRVIGAGEVLVRALGEQESPRRGLFTGRLADDGGGDCLVVDCREVLRRAA